MKKELIRINNLKFSLYLMSCLYDGGLENIVICPGSRSGPLAIAANLFSKYSKLNLITTIDERSGAFYALGRSTASGKFSAVITTSGSAVANLLPAAVEADRSCQSILCITADRPERLKDCGANQTVNQEDFLKSVIRSFVCFNKDGIHRETFNSIENFCSKILKTFKEKPGPVHLNIPIEKPLDISKKEEKEAIKFILEKLRLDKIKPKKSLNNKLINSDIELFDFSKLGVVIAGPWRGNHLDLAKFNHALFKFQRYSGWPIFADPLSGVSSQLSGLISYWDLIIRLKKLLNNDLQVLRLGPMPSSIPLEDWLSSNKAKQILITEGENRYLDPLLKANQYSLGLANWIKILFDNNLICKNPNTILFDDLYKKDELIKKFLYKNFARKDNLTESYLSYIIPKIWPKKYSLMLSASSPIRDWITFSGSDSLNQRTFGFRGASGIDGTLSLGFGICSFTKKLILITGDLAFLHDQNGFLLSNYKDIGLLILLIDNKGGGIFNSINKSQLDFVDFKKVFIMPQEVNWFGLKRYHDIPIFKCNSLKDLIKAINWYFLNKKTQIILVETNSIYEQKIKEKIFNNLIDKF